jgi:hypothetical protein
MKRVMKFIIIVMLTIACFVGLFRFLFPDDFELVTGLTYSFLQNDVLGNLYPFQERAISTKISPDGKLEVSSICRRNLSLITGSTIYLDVVDIERSDHPVRFFVADKDVVQDCDSFSIESMTASDNSLTVVFAQNQKLSVDFQ